MNDYLCEFGLSSAIIADSSHPELCHLIYGVTILMSKGLIHLIQHSDECTLNYRLLMIQYDFIWIIGSYVC